MKKKKINLFIKKIKNTTRSNQQNQTFRAFWLRVQLWAVRVEQQARLRAADYIAQNNNRLITSFASRERIVRLNTWNLDFIQRHQLYLQILERDIQREIALGNNDHALALRLNQRNEQDARIFLEMYDRINQARPAEIERNLLNYERFSFNDPAGALIFYMERYQYSPMGRIISHGNLFGAIVGIVVLMFKFILAVVFGVGGAIGDAIQAFWNNVIMNPANPFRMFIIRMFNRLRAIIIAIIRYLINLGVPAPRFPDDERWDGRDRYDDDHDPDNNPNGSDDFGDLGQAPTDKSGDSEGGQEDGNVSQNPDDKPSDSKSSPSFSEDPFGHMARMGKWEDPKEDPNNRFSTSESHDDSDSVKSTNSKCSNPQVTKSKTLTTDEMQSIVDRSRQNYHKGLADSESSQIHRERIITNKNQSTMEAPIKNKDLNTHNTCSVQSPTSTKKKKV